MPTQEESTKDKIEIFEHCPECGTHTGNGRRCVSCEDQLQNELETVMMDE